MWKYGEPRTIKIVKNKSKDLHFWFQELLSSYSDQASYVTGIKIDLHIIGTEIRVLGHITLMWSVDKVSR